MARPKALIFDMDGLLLDTEGLYKRSWSEVAKEMGFDLTDTLYLKLIGITVADAEEVLHQSFGSGFDKAAFHTTAAARYEKLHETEGFALKIGVKELLSWAKENNIPCALGTSTVHLEAKKRLEKHEIDQYIQAIVGGDMVERGKPHPDTFIKAQEALGVAPADCLVLEDAHSGLLAAKAGGMRSCLVPDMLPASDESRKIAEGVFNSLLEVRDWLEHHCPALATQECR
ncbi:MAG: HAD family phosphatase [Candidatus Obscuribacterales bacterium]|nr:HAD family phosphatase [Candidatus Obscuribacterales bacterium]